jgi:hypothetical protein
MMSRTHPRSIGASRFAIAMAAMAVALLGVSAQPALGQIITGVAPVTQAARPYRGLFGAGTGAAPGRHLFALTASVYEEYGNNQSGNIPTSDLVLRDGWFLGVRAQLAFEKAGQHSRIGLRGEGAFRYLRDLRETTSPRFRAELSVDGRTGARKQNLLRFTGSADYEPYYILSIFPTAVLPTGDTAILPTNRDDLLFTQTRYIYGQTFSYEQQLSRRSYLAFFEDWRTTQAQRPTTGLDVNGLRAGARYGYRMSPHASLRFGYAYRLGNYGLGAAQRFEAHDVDVSFDYRKPLSNTRNTSFGFGAGSSRISRDTEPVWTVVGNANLRHEFGRGWFIRADFTRNAQLVEGFREPFFVNTVTGSLGGFLSHRVEVLASSGYSRGPVGFGSGRYDSRQSSARLRWALARHFAVDAEGLLVQYGFGTQVMVPGTVPASLDRWAVRCNLAWWLPLSR